MRSEQLVHAIMLGIVEVPAVPEQREAAARTEDAADLRYRLARPEPVERLCARDCVDATVSERDRLGGAGERLDFRDGALELGAHGVDRLDGDDAGSQRDELAGELARACGEVEHIAAGADAEPLRDPGHRVVRVARTRPLVDLGGRREAGFRRRMNPRHWGVMR